MSTLNLTSLYLFVLIMYPYFQVLEHFTGTYSKIGKNGYLIVITLALLLLFIHAYKELIKKYRSITVALLYFIGFSLAVFFTRIIVYNETFSRLFPDRYTYFILIYGILTYYFVATKPELKNTIIKIVIGNALAQAVFGVIHYYFMPFLIPVTDNPAYVNTGLLFVLNYTNADSVRETGLLGNASVYANFILLGLFLLFRPDNQNVRNVTKFFISIVLIMAIFVSGSRFPTAVSLILLMIFLYRNTSRLQMAIVSFFLISFLLLFFTFFVPVDQFMYYLDRIINEGNSIRDEKVLLAFNMLFSKPLFLLLGVPQDIVVNTTSPSGYTFSDNSFFEFALNHGVLFTLAWFLVAIVMLKRSIVANKYVVLFLTYFFLCLWFTNSILWDIWIVYFFVVLYCLSPSSCNEKDFYVNRSC